MEDKKVIANSQLGFMNGRSCLTNPIAFSGEMTGCVPKGRTEDVEHLDFSEASSLRSLLVPWQPTEPAGWLNSEVDGKLPALLGFKFFDEWYKVWLVPGCCGPVLSEELEQVTCQVPCSLFDPVPMAESVSEQQ